jgi:ankyrin repeat protein
MRAASKGDTSAVRRYLDRGEDIDAIDALECETALMKAASEGRTETVKRLIDRGASLKAEDCCGQTAVIKAAAGGHIDTVELLIDRAGIAPGTAILLCPIPLRLVEIDGHPVEKELDPCLLYTHHYKTLPAGAHNIKVEYAAPNAYGEPISVTTKVTTGHIYGVEHAIVDEINKWNAWIERYGPLSQAMSRGEKRLVLTNQVQEVE